MSMFNWKKPLSLLVAVACFCGGCRQESEEVKATTREKAEQGDAWSQHNLGDMYRKGEGVPQDDVEAAKWYRKAAEQGHALAQYYLGEMYDDGRGVPQDDVETAKWFRKAAEQGIPPAQFFLGLMYYRGHGVLQDYVEAMKWFRKAAEQGTFRVDEGSRAYEVRLEQDGAQYNLGLMYYRGHGVLQDYVEAMKWFRKAAEQGKAHAQWYLGEMYAKGEGVTQDEVEGYAWYLLANVKTPAEAGAGEKISALEEILTAEQMEKAKARAVELQRLIDAK